MDSSDASLLPTIKRSRSNQPFPSDTNFSTTRLQRGVLIARNHRDSLVLNSLDYFPDGQIFVALAVPSMQNKSWTRVSMLV